ncbi:MAG: DNA-3-methyladenine glycosylase I [Ktedonobacteraceae bacterium]|nr:DNA-3-methyladenine glycosylase I [Ktedonobacteraceae bacterium]
MLAGASSDEEALKQRCNWAYGGQFYIDYHDSEWGVPLHDDRKLFEFLILEGAQAGLSWSLILRRRAAYVQAFDGFDAARIARYDEQKCQELLANSEIVRNRLKIQATIKNARAFLQVQERYGSFDAFIWQFVDGRPIQNAWKTMQDVPVTTRESDAMSKVLKKLGFTFVGSTICYSLMQAVGMVNDHTVDCFRWAEVKALATVS